MNAILLLSSVWMAGADPVAAPAVATPAVVSGSGCGGCSGCGPTVGCSQSTCGKASLFDRIRAKFAKSDCGCEQSSCCEKAPKCERAPRCKPACGTPLFSKPIFHGCTTSCKDTGCNTGCNSGCSGSCDSCDKPGLLDRLKARFASRKHSSCDCAPSSCCGSAAPAGCSLPPAPTAPGAPSTPSTPPKSMPDKKTGISVPSLTPAAGITPAPMPSPVFNGSKSPF